MGITGDIVIKYLQEWPDLPTHTLASKIYNENKSAFTNKESVRTRIRYYRGQHGEEAKGKRISADGRRLFKETPDSTNIFDKLPAGLKYFDEWEPHQIKGHSILILSDTHIPYHDKDALRIALEYAYNEEEIDTILFLGDLVDFYSVSFWEKDPRNRAFQSELDQTYSTLNVIRDAFPNAEFIYKIGNHEERLERYLKVKAPELLDMEVLQFSEIIKADEYKIKIVADKRIVKIGRLNCIHGHEWRRGISNPVNPARGLFLRGNAIALCAHFHQSSHHVNKNMDDKIISCWSIGCLCDLRPDWSPMNKWNTGFAIVHRYKGKEFQVFTKQIINGKVY